MCGGERQVRHEHDPTTAAFRLFRSFRMGGFEGADHLNSRGVALDPGRGTVDLEFLEDDCARLARYRVPRDSHYLVGGFIGRFVRHAEAEARELRPRSVYAPADTSAVGAIARDGAPASRCIRWASGATGGTSTTGAPATCGTGPAMDPAAVALAIRTRVRCGAGSRFMRNLQEESRCKR